ncbi:conserved hypothetical protein [Mycolicibacterium smegmatis MC2 155]|uniref:Uncharacterized protein n=1 Tax=Mycolicibacterium smegmatis (strain ATCC 700084 / mc(2)155) TaxID=246196 RepID=A0R5G3_MYCS2|nr:conserved hypothetical protein [Mycolicibacterium smegmatis MC2 155]
MARRQCLTRFLDGFDGLARPADTAHLEETEQRQRARDHQHDGEHDQERDPPPQPRVEKFGQEEEEKERRVEQHHERGDEEDAAREALLDVARDLGLGQFHLGAHERRDLRGGVLDQIADRRIRLGGVRIHQRNRGHRCRYAVPAVANAHGHILPGSNAFRGSCCHAGTG